MIYLTVALPAKIAARVSCHTRGPSSCTCVAAQLRAVVCGNGPCLLQTCIFVQHAGGDLLRFCHRRSLHIHKNT